MMALQCAEAGLLRAARGDVVLFANTTAEHPGTYDFAARVSDEIEGRFGIPCLWYEGCTVETAVRSGYTRTRSYRLVARRPARPDDAPAVPGYRHGGEAFEEMVAWGRLPSRWRRICTTELKVQPGNLLVSEWLSGGPGPARRGHHGDEPFAAAAAVAGRYNGSLPREERAKRLRAVCGMPWARPAQQWQDFTSVELGRPASGPRTQMDIWGRFGRPETFVSMLGLRADEPKRAASATWRSLMAEGASGSGCRDRSQPAGEYVYCPPHDGGVTEPDVRAYWRARPYDLSIPEGAGNCVFCFLKGDTALSRLAATLPTNSDDASAGTPVDIRWWSRLEEDYGRPSTVRDGTVGMFHGTSYAEIARRADGQENGSRAAASGVGVPCSCTD